MTSNTNGNHTNGGKGRARPVASSVPPDQPSDTSAPTPPASPFDHAPPSGSAQTVSAVLGETCPGASAGICG